MKALFLLVVDSVKDDAHYPKGTVVELVRVGGPGAHLYKSQPGRNYDLVIVSPVKGAKGVAVMDRPSPRRTSHVFKVFEIKEGDRPCLAVRWRDLTPGNEEAQAVLAEMALRQETA